MHGHNSQSHICQLLSMERLHDADGGTSNQEVVYNIFAVSVAFHSSVAQYVILKKEEEKSRKNPATTTNQQTKHNRIKQKIKKRYKEEKKKKT